MNNYYRAYISIFLSVITLCLSAQFNYDKTAQKVHNNILSINGFKINSTKVENNGIYLWLESYDSFMKTITTSEVVDVDYVISNINNNLRLISNLSHTSPFYYYCSADLHLFLSFLYFEQGKLISSLYQFVKAKNFISTQQSNFPDFEFANKHKLVLFFINSFIDQQIGFSSIPDYELQKQYINLLNGYLKSTKGVFYREMKVLGVLLASYQSNIDAKLVIKQLNIDLNYASTGPIETYVSSYWYKKDDDFTKQILIFRYSEYRGYQDRFNALDLWYGNALLNQYNDSSIIYLERFLRNQKNGKFIEYARFKASLYWFLKGDKQKSDSLNSLIETNNIQLMSYEDKQAVYEIKNARNWNKELVLARILFDGGDYIKASEALLLSSNKMNYNNDQRLEYNYRMGRIYHKFNDMINAELFYNKVINSGMDSEFYYPAYASYYLGVLYQKNGYYDKANNSFGKCIKLDSPIYKDSIHKKAKSLKD